MKLRSHYFFAAVSVLTAFVSALAAQPARASSFTDGGGRIVAAPSYVLPTDSSSGFLVASWYPGQPNQVD